MSMKAVHRVLDLIDKHFDENTPIDFLNDTTLEHYKIPVRKIYLILENLIAEEMILGIELQGSYDEFIIKQDTPRLTFKGMNWLYTIVV